MSQHMDNIQALIFQLGYTTFYIINLYYFQHMWTILKNEEKNYCAFGVTIGIVF